MKTLSKSSLLFFGFVSMSASYAFDMSSPANSLVVDTSGKVGIGLSTPLTGLHVVRSDGKGIVKVEETNANIAKRFQVQLKNNGGTGFLMTYTSV